MPRLPFKQVDVFTNRPFMGNPVAVVLGADEIAPDQMQRIAAWTNLSETTFVLRPTSDEADYRLRIFSPGGELPFAGHPTIGSAHAVLEAGVVRPRPDGMRQECGAGILPLTVEGEGGDRRISVLVPKARVVRRGADMAESLSAALGSRLAGHASPMVINVGPVWLVAGVESVDLLQRMQPDMAALTRLSRELEVVGVTVFALTPAEESAIRVRSFAPAVGVLEDPVCGSGNATVAAYLAETEMLRQTGESYIASQGTELGRDGRVSVTVLDGGSHIEIGGHAVTVIEGEIRL